MNVVLLYPVRHCDNCIDRKCTTCPNRGYECVNKAEWDKAVAEIAERLGIPVDKLDLHNVYVCRECRVKVGAIGPGTFEENFKALAEEASRDFANHMSRLRGTLQQQREDERNRRMMVMRLAMFMDPNLFRVLLAIDKETLKKFKRRAERKGY